MTILGIETSTAVCSIGIVGDAGLSVERSLVEARIHSEKLLSLVREVCGAAGITLQDLDGVAVSLGPGSFTGLRIGLSSAKGLCMALDKPIVGVPTFEAVATAALSGEQDAGAVALLVDARQGDWYVGLFDRKGRGVAGRSAVAVQPLSPALIPADIPLVLTDARERISGVAGIDCRDIHPYCRGSVVAALGRERLEAGRASDLVTLEPAYLKEFVVRSPRLAASVAR